MTLLQERHVRKLSDEDLNACLHLLMYPETQLIFGQGAYYHTTAHAAQHCKIVNYLGPCLALVQEKLLNSHYGFSWMCKQGFNSKTRSVFIRHQAQVWRAESPHRYIRVVVKANAPSLVDLHRAFAEAVVKFNCGLILMGDSGEIKSAAAEMVQPTPGIHLL